MEDKQAICGALCAALRLTRQFRDLERLDYQMQEDGEEIVTARFKGGNKEICVTWDSGAGVIRDVVRCLQ